MKNESIELFNIHVETKSFFSTVGGGASRNFDWLLVSKCQMVDKLGASSRYYFGISDLTFANTRTYT